MIQNLQVGLYGLGLGLGSWPLSNYKAKQRNTNYTMTEHKGYKSTILIGLNFDHSQVVAHITHHYTYTTHY